MAKRNSFNWEYWPSYMFYIPILPYAFWLAIKAKSFAFFHATNPGIDESGNGLESKYSTLQKIPSKYIPNTLFIPKNSSFDFVKKQLSQSDIKYPLIIKPDIGFRGLLVTKIKSENELKKYLNSYNSINLIIQEFIYYDYECGIFFYKIPSKNTGSISSITLKKYLKINGDGISSLEKLIDQHPRAFRYKSLYKKLFKDDFSKILEKNEEFVVSTIGNHSKGTEFLCGNHLLNSTLENTINSISKEIDGWYYGRLDIKYNNFNELSLGKNFKIIELNGIISEPTNIYDPSKFTYFKAINEISKHWKVLYKIARANKSSGIGKYENLPYLLSLISRYKKYTKKVNALSNH